MNRTLFAVVQMTSGSDTLANLATVEKWTRKAAGRGARYVLVPENFAFLGDGSPSSDETRVKIAETIPGGPIVERMARLAEETKVHLVLGAMPERAPGEAARAFNTEVVLGPDGKVLATYRKIHLFDVSFDGGPTHKESRTIAPGETKAVVARLPDVALGLAICYDLRFPELFRRLALDGAEALTMPAAFTLHTGKDHWEPLVRARAIENTCYVAAAAQWGTHHPGRSTWGKSMIVDPWGQILAAVPEGEGIAVAELDPDALAKIRKALPTLAHVRL